jgi:hypothetical protein
MQQLVGIGIDRDEESGQLQSGSAVVLLSGAQKLSQALIDLPRCLPTLGRQDRIHTNFDQAK